MTQLARHLKDLDGGRILDVATGFGDFLKELTESFGSYTEAIGVDFNERITEATKNHAETDMQFLTMDAEKLDFEDDSFDTVSIRHSLHHLTNLGTVLGEIKRVLKPGGLLILGEVIQAPETEQPNSQRHLHHFWAEVDRLIGNPHYQTFTSEQVLEIVAKAGWTPDATFEEHEEPTEEENQEALDSMLQHTRSMVEKLEEMGDREELEEQGRELLERFERLGVVHESSVFILAHN